ncbi:hypothetical protein [Frankia sp. Cas4]|uniref:hypothetical protein n=1 Tax=Frankia sp. Cas4 TaxID=3073927 RepID=UPI002AD4E91F|nr:hypothetical protein [Frankia sp. Cas4]
MPTCRPLPGDGREQIPNLRRIGDNPAVHSLGNLRLPPLVTVHRVRAEPPPLDRIPENVMEGDPVNTVIFSPDGHWIATDGRSRSATAGHPQGTERS